MSAKLDKTIKRELDLDGKLYTVTISPEGVKITAKGARKGPEMSWQSLLSGEAELHRDLNMNLSRRSHEVTERTAVRERNYGITCDKFEPTTRRSALVSP